MAITLNGTTGISSPGGDTSTSLATTNLSYTGTLTGGTGVIAIGTNQIYKDASGNLGLGVTPSAYLTAVPAIQLGQISVLSQDVNSFYLNANASAPYGKYLKTGNYAVSYHLDSAAGSHKWFNSNGVTGTAGNIISPTQAMTLDSSGNLLVGTTSGTGYCRMNLSTDSGTNKWDVGPRLALATNFYILQNQANGVYIASGANAWTTYSDERLKTDLKPIENAAQKVSTLRAVTGRFKTDEERVSRSFLIAQDVQAVLPEAVDASDPDKLGVAYTDTIPLLVAAIKELTTRLEALEAQ